MHLDLSFRSKHHNNKRIQSNGRHADSHRGPRIYCITHIGPLDGPLHLHPGRWCPLGTSIPGHSHTVLVPAHPRSPDNADSVNDSCATRVEYEAGAGRRNEDSSSPAADKFFPPFFVLLRRSGLMIPDEEIPDNEVVQTTRQAGPHAYQLDSVLIIVMSVVSVVAELDDGRPVERARVWCPLSTPRHAREMLTKPNCRSELRPFH